jgi:hypothetical protein
VQLDLGSMCHIINTDAVKSVYFAYFHSTMKYGIIFWGNSSNSKMILTLQKQIIRLMADVKPRNSCSSLFKSLEILTLSCEYIFSLLLFTVNNKEHLQTNYAVHSVNTRNKNRLHRPIANLSCFQKRVYCAAIKMLNSLPTSLKSYT